LDSRDPPELTVVSATWLSLIIQEKYLYNQWQKRLLPFRRWCR
jgi:hypothetical protein